MTFTDRYDAAIQRHCAKRMPLWDWRRIKAQLIAESGLDPNAVSGADAQGIAQFLPDTFKQVRETLGYPADATPFMADVAIDCCCAYMAGLYGQWRAHRTERDRWCLALASYNAGLGNLLKAQAASGGLTDFTGIMSYLPGVTGDKAIETRDYINRIERTLAQLQAAEGSPV
jgi:soluble lytic murein transglycosylase-like protein